MAKVTIDPIAAAQAEKIYLRVRGGLLKKEQSSKTQFEVARLLQDYKSGIQDEPETEGEGLVEETKEGKKDAKKDKK